MHIKHDLDIESAYAIFRTQIKKFVEYNDAEWEVVKSHLNLTFLKKKKFFATPEAVCNDIGFVVSGSVRYYYIKDGEEITNYFSFENEFTSSYKSFLTRQLHTGTRRYNACYHQLQKLAVHAGRPTNRS